MEDIFKWTCSTFSSFCADCRTHTVNGMWAVYQLR